MKIGILTFSCAYNFGAILQCYALQEALFQMGHDVKVINYRPSYLKFRRPMIVTRKSISNPKEIFNSIKSYGIRKEMYSKYSAFCSKELRLTKKISTNNGLSKIAEIFDIIVIGSDQVWNPKFNGRDLAWLGTFACGRAKLITYAASAGDIETTDSYFNNIFTALDSFTAISVREESLKNKISSRYKKKKIYCTIDPSLLFDKSIWAVKDWLLPIISGKYILVYQARTNDNVLRIANTIGRELCAKVIAVDFSKNHARFNAELYVASPSEFVSLVNNAQCVVTTSFHATAFSIITNTPFYSIKLDDGSDGRVQNLLESVGLTERFISKDVTPSFSAIDYTTVNRKLSNLREESQLFLSRSIDDIQVI